MPRFVLYAARRVCGLTKPGTQSKLATFHRGSLRASISVGDTLSASPTTNLAICFTLITYFASSVFGLMIFVQRATCVVEGRLFGWGETWEKAEAGLLRVRLR